MSKKYSYGLDNEMMALLENEFQISALMDSYGKRVENIHEEGREGIAQEIFGAFGKRLAERICDVEGRYRDRGAEVAYWIAEKTGHPFPALVQRPLEIGILAVMNENRWQYDEVSYKRLAYAVGRCVVNQALEMSVGKNLAAEVPCRHLCLGLCTGICRQTGLLDSVTIHMPDRISGEKGFCAFEILYHTKDRRG